MATILTPDQLKSRFTGMNKRLVWQLAVDLYNKIRVHADGDTPIWLIKDARPNESEQVRDYREKIYEPETQNPVERVIGVLEKIRRSPDWMIRFSEADVPAIITPGETLEEYIEGNYPVYGCLEDWLFEEALRNIALDANAVIVVMPKKLEVNPQEYLQPVAQIFNSPSVVDFVPEEYVVLKSDEFSSLLTPEQQQTFLRNTDSVSTFNKTKTEGFTAGQVYYVINTIYYQKWEETGEGKYKLTQQLVHNLGALPAWQMPGKFIKRIGTDMLKRTMLNPMVPHLNKAARESNDLDAGVIMHLYLEKWRINNIPCTTCNGAGKTTSTAGPVQCKTCGGSGLASGKSPFNEIQIKPQALGQANIPVPPVGYVVKDPEILRLQNERIKEHIYKSLEAVNMEHLSDVQLNQSGTAKAYDGDEVNNVISAFAESLVSLANISVYWINEIRYMSIVPNEEQRKSMLPVIPVPEKFDVVNTSILLQEYQVAKTAGLNSIILSEMQKEISQKKFYANPDVADFVDIVMNLDPFPDKTIDDKAMMESNKMATQEDIILSVYISDFVKRAMEEDKKFADKPKEAQKELLLKYTQEKIDQLSTVNQISQDIFPGNAAGQPPAPAGQAPINQPPKDQTQTGAAA